MDNLKDIFARYGTAVGGGIFGLVATSFVFRRLLSHKERRCGIDYPKDKVIVHEFGKGTFAPSIGHFVMKLETYLRMAKIPYEPYYSTYGGNAPKGKSPWIEYNGVTMGDSQLIINFLNREFNVDLNRHLSPTEKAQAWAIQKWLEEFTYCADSRVRGSARALQTTFQATETDIVLNRKPFLYIFRIRNQYKAYFSTRWLNVHTKWAIFLDDFYNVMTHKMSAILKPFFGRYMKKQTFAVGVGRHSNEEVGQMMVHDLEMLSTLLGEKKFFMGTEPCELDCAAFGQLVQYLYNTPDGCPGKQILKGKLTNLTDYIDRMKELYWPDWNDRITGRPQ